MGKKILPIEMEMFVYLNPWETICISGPIENATITYNVV